MRAPGPVIGTAGWRTGWRFRGGGPGGVRRAPRRVGERAGPGTRRGARCCRMQQKVADRGLRGGEREEEGDGADGGARGRAERTAGRSVGARWRGGAVARCGANRSGAVRCEAVRTSRRLPLAQRLQPPARMPRRTHCAHCATGTHRAAFGAAHCARSHPRVPPHYHPRWPAPCVPALPPAAPARYRATRRAVAQFGSATGLGPVGRRFKSGQPDQFGVRERGDRVTRSRRTTPRAIPRSAPATAWRDPASSPRRRDRPAAWRRARPPRPAGRPVAR